MSEPFDAFRYISYLRSQWRWIAGSAALAMVLAGAASLAMTKKYTATARVVIEPPAGADLRAGTAVSPIYLESLRTYESFAESDSLFLKAAKEFSLTQRPIEALKRQVLNVQLVRNTRILEISATLPQPDKAQALAKFIAEATVEINRSSVQDSDRDLLQGIERQASELRTRMNEADAKWAKALETEPVVGLQSAMERAAELQGKIEEQAQNLEIDIADLGERAGAANNGEWRKEQTSAKSRLAQMRQQIQDLERQNAERDRVLSTRRAHHDQLEAERKAAQTALAGMEVRLRDARGESGFRGERLKILDPGIVPERPSSPNLPLNMAVALLAGLLLPLLYLTLRMSFQQKRAMVERQDYWVAHGRDK